jgi:hypothetical protein
MGLILDIVSWAQPKPFYALRAAIPGLAYGQSTDDRLQGEINTF